MALPRLNEIPWYPVTIPSTGLKTRFRPYMVKEEKILLIALESQDQFQITHATADLIVSCIEADIDKRSLTTYDIEYLFVKIRSKAVGEKIELNVACGKCDEDVEFVVDLDAIDIPTPKSDATIKLTDDVEVVMKSLSYIEAVENEKIINPESYAEFVFESVVRCLSEVRTEDEIINVQEEGDEEITAFLESLDTQTFNKLREFVEDIPSIQSEVDYQCSACGATSVAKLRGLTDFFA